MWIKRLLEARERETRMNQEQERQLSRAFERCDAGEVLLDVAIAWKQIGMSQREVYDIFGAFRARAEDRGEDETKVDSILDVMDRICGWCGPHARLFDSYM